MMMLRRKRSTVSRMSGSACEFSERSVDALIGTCALHPSQQTALTRDLPLSGRRRLSSRVSCLLRLLNRQLLKLLSITCIPLPVSLVMTMIRARLARWNVRVCCLDWRTSICFSSSRLYPVVRSLGQLSLVFCKGFAMQFFAPDGFYQSLYLGMRVYTCMDAGSTVTNLWNTLHHSAQSHYFALALYTGLLSSSPGIAPTASFDTRQYDHRLRIRMCISLLTALGIWHQSIKEARRATNPDRRGDKLAGMARRRRGCSVVLCLLHSRFPACTRPLLSLCT